MNRYFAGREVAYMPAVQIQYLLSAAWLAFLFASVVTANRLSSMLSFHCSLLRKREELSLQSKHRMQENSEKFRISYCSMIV